MTNDEHKESPADVLERWREAERRLQDFEEGSAEWHRTRVEVDELANAYQALLSERDEIARDLAAGPAGGTGEGLADVIRASPANPDRR